MSAVSKLPQACAIAIRNRVIRHSQHLLSKPSPFKLSRLREKIHCEKNPAELQLHHSCFTPASMPGSSVTHSCFEFVPCLVVGVVAGGPLQLG